MSDMLAALALISQVIRTALLAGGLAFAVVATLDWAARTRRLNPFGGVARFVRARVDPRLAGIERQVMRVGGHPASTPLWALVLYVVCAMLVIALVDTLLGALVALAHASSLGALGVLSLAVDWTFALLRFALLVRVVSSFVPALRHRRWVSWSYAATDWMLRPLRRLIPSFGVIDVTPLVAYFALGIAEWIVQTVLLAGAR
jgi:YggT family protein